MHHYRIALEEPVAETSRGEFESRIYFVSGLIEKFSLTPVDGWIREVSISTARPIDEADITRKISLLVSRQITPLLSVPQKEIWRSKHQPHLVQNVFEDMLARGMVTEAGEGQMALSGDFLGLMAYLDGRIRDIVGEEFSGREYRYPTLIPFDVIKRTGYLSSFPQYLMFVTRLHSDLDTYAEFQQAFSEGDADPAVLRNCGQVDYCLPPTMCFHTYHQLRGQAVPNGVVTARGKSFRFESRYSRSLERLWDFTIREIVFVGSRDFVLGRREDFMNRVFALAEELELAGHSEPASDLFFRQDDTAEQIATQRLMELKYELRLPVAADRTISVGSFNFHERFFAESFDISHTDGVPAYTGCAGIGLERITYAFLCQHGLDPGQWPVAARRALSLAL
ncbi:hypothetical protein OG741_29685 [Streptomyces sp. NBC_01410]|uniref:hypothetical protein n=1 Tax=Streptomyces sp. NBC_01410 TaxID=2903856 RepID=UPI003249BCD2